MNQNTRNSLTIDEVKSILCAEHAARAFTAEVWWAIVCNKDNSFAKTGDASPFWALVNATRELGQPLGFEKLENHLGQQYSVGHNDPEKLLRSVIKINLKQSPPVREVIEARAKWSNGNAEQMMLEAQAAYTAALKAEEARINRVISKIMQQEPAMIEALGEHLPADNSEVDTLDENGDLSYNIWEGNEMGGDWSIPIDRIIELGERQLKFIAINKAIPAVVFATEAALWEGEFTQLKAIVQKDMEAGGCPNYVAEMDNRLLDASGMQAGMNSGK